jgi:hypothetical protein
MFEPSTKKLPKMKHQSLPNLNRMGSNQLLKKIAKGNMSILHANMAAEVLERRFPTPPQNRKLKFVSAIRKVG